MPSDRRGVRVIQNGGLLLDDADEFENQHGEDAEQKKGGGPGDPSVFLIF